MRILIVEDEPLYVTQLSLLVEDLGHGVVGTAAEAETAFRIAAADPPDLVLMDINISGGYDGVEAAERLAERHRCAIIFVTAQQDDLTFRRASRIGPVNFLLKPFDELQFRRAVQLAASRISAPTDDIPERQEVADEEENLYVKTGHKLRKIPVASISAVAADGHYCEIHSETNRYLIRMSFRELTDRLPADRFLKTHRGHLVNEAFVESVDLRDSEIILRGGRRVPLAKREREAFLKRIGK